MDDSSTIRANLDEVVVERFFENNQFFLVYQKKVALDSPTVFKGLEAYLRLKAAGLESQSPAVFLPVVRRMGLLSDLSRLLIQKLIEDWETLRATGIEPEITINMDVELFSNRTLLQNIVEQVDASLMPLNQLRIDLVATDNHEIIQSEIDGVRYLKDKGVHISLEVNDNNELTIELVRNLYIDEIKIGRRLFSEDRQDDASDVIKRCRHYMDELGGELTAVGVESEAEFVFLHDFQIDYVQGFLFNKPVAINELDQAQSAPDVEDEDAITIIVVENGLQFKQRLDAFIHKKGYEVIPIQDVLSLDEKVSDINPDIIVFEVESAEDKAFSQAAELNNNTDIFRSIIFVSDKQDDQLFLRCYESNGFAYLYQDLAVIELIACFNRAINIQKINKRIKLSAKQSSELALQSMRDAANYGDIVQLMKAICIAGEEMDISNALFRYMRQRHLHCSVVFRDGESVVGYDSTNIHCTPTELNVFEILKDRGRLYEFGQRIVVNGENTAFLIKNLPDDESERGQIRDYVAAIIECMDARCSSILQNKAIEQAIAGLMEVSMEAMDSVEQSAQKKKQMIDYLNVEIGMSFHVLDLTIEQEDYLKDVVNKLLQEYDWDEEGASRLATKLQGTIEDLSARLVKKTSTNSLLEEVEGDDVELF